MQTKCNRKNSDERRFKERSAVRYPQVQKPLHRIPHYPTSKNLTGKVIDAGVTLGAMAIGASLVSGVVGTLAKK